MRERANWFLSSRSILIILVAILVLGAPAWAAENRLPANRTYLAFVQGTEDDPLLGGFTCVQFTRQGQMTAGDASGQWWIDEELTRSANQRAVSFEITALSDDDPPVELQIEGLCWLDNLGPRNTLACAMHGEAGGLRANLGLTARPLGGGVGAAALANCQARAAALNALLGAG